LTNDWAGRKRPQARGRRRPAEVSVICLVGGEGRGEAENIPRAGARSYGGAPTRRQRRDLKNPVARLPFCQSFCSRRFVHRCCCVACTFGPAFSIFNASSIATLSSRSSPFASSSGEFLTHTSGGIP